MSSIMPSTFTTPDHGYLLPVRVTSAQYHRTIRWTIAWFLSWYFLTQSLWLKYVQLPCNFRLPLSGIFSLFHVVTWSPIDHCKATEVNMIAMQSLRSQCSQFTAETYTHAIYYWIGGGGYVERGCFVKKSQLIWAMTGDLRKVWTKS